MNATEKFKAKQRKAAADRQARNERNAARSRDHGPHVEVPSSFATTAIPMPHQPSVEECVRKAARAMKKKLQGLPPFDGRPETRWVQQAAIRDDLDLGGRVCLTRDEGHHRSGLFKNARLERCLHLTVCDGSIIQAWPSRSRRAIPAEALPLLLAAVFGVDVVPLAWEEVVKDRPKESEPERVVRHWRVWCDKDWEPLVPSEAAVKEMRELGWRSAVAAPKESSDGKPK